MKQRMKVLLTFSALVLGVSATSQTHGQESFEVAYGNGVHLYFNGEYEKAHEMLSSAVTENRRDPRAYYFRGLASFALGKSADTDFQLGAHLEAVRGGRLSLVNDALERVQGPTRVSIEKMRAQAILESRSAGAQSISGVKLMPFDRNEANTVMVPAKRKIPSPDIAKVAPGQEVEAPQKTPSPVVDEVKAASEVAKTAGPAVASNSDNAAPNNKTETKKEAVKEENPFGKVESTEEDSPFGKVQESKDDNPFGEVEAAPSSKDSKADEIDDPFEL